MELEFNKPETFDAPNIEGKSVKYVVLPMQVEYIPKLLEFIDMEQEKKKNQAKNAKARQKKDMPFEFDEKIGELVRFIIDKGVKSIDTGEVLPDYNRSPKVVMFLINKIIEITGIADGDGDGTPLNTPAKT
jgi:hypothetical protein